MVNSSISMCVRKLILIKTDTAAVSMLDSML